MKLANHAAALSIQKEGTIESYCDYDTLIKDTLIKNRTIDEYDE